MLARYKLPIQGKVLKREPLTGDSAEPITVFPIVLLPGQPTYYHDKLKMNIAYGYSYVCLDYDIDNDTCEIELDADEKVHAWLAAHLENKTDIENIRAARNLKLDKSKIKSKD